MHLKLTTRAGVSHHHPLDLDDADPALIEQAAQAAADVLTRRATRLGADARGSLEALRDADASARADAAEMARALADRSRNTD